MDSCRQAAGSPEGQDCSLSHTHTGTPRATLGHRRGNTGHPEVLQAGNEASSNFSLWPASKPRKRTMAWLYRMLCSPSFLFFFYFYFLTLAGNCSEHSSPRSFTAQLHLPCGDTPPASSLGPTSDLWFQADTSGSGASWPWTLNSPDLTVVVCDTFPSSKETGFDHWMQGRQRFTAGWLGLRCSFPKGPTAPSAPAHTATVKGNSRGRRTFIKTSSCEACRCHGDERETRSKGAAGPQVM